MKINTDPRVPHVFNNYPDLARTKLEQLRELIIDAAYEVGTITSIDETLKWGEPSYLVEKGSTIRMDWKSKAPDQYAVYFSCSTSLVETFKILHGDLFQYEKNRAIIFGLNDSLPEKELKQCITMALTYQSVKHLPLLGG